MKTKAWTIEHGQGLKTPAELIEREVEVQLLEPDDILFAPIYACWEANLQHAIQRQPVDICQQRQEEFIIIGNACVSKILAVGKDVTNLQVGDICLGYGGVKVDAYGYPETVFGYDAPKSFGALAKVSKAKKHNMIPLPKNTQFSLPQWAAFCARYVSAWSNWQVAFKCWKAQMEKAATREHFVCAWGGGVSLAELQLAQHEGFQTIMISSNESRLHQIKQEGITPLNRKEFLNLNFNPKKYFKDQAFREQYQKDERLFLKKIYELTAGKMASIFIDNIGLPVYRASIRALARQGVIATCGWKLGMELSNFRAIECINRHTHVHTHYATYEEVAASIQYAEQHAWMPAINSTSLYQWEEVPRLSKLYEQGAIDSYFPIIEINHPSSLETINYD